MCEYALIMLHTPEYACINLNKQSSECIFDAVCAVYSIWSLYKSLSSYQDSQTFKMKSFTKRIMPSANKYKFFGAWEVLSN